MNCCEGEKRSGLHETILTLPKMGWYYGNVTVQEAELLLQEQPNGSFLVRDTTDSLKHSELYTITFKVNNRCGSIRIDYAKGYFTLSLQDPGLPLFRTMMDLVGYCYSRSVTHRKPVCVLTGHHSSRDVLLFLTKPVSRFNHVHSLLYYCRSSLHTYLTLDRIAQLDLPRHLSEGFLQRNPLFDEEIHSPPVDDSKSMSGNSASGSELELQTHPEMN